MRWTAGVVPAVILLGACAPGSAPRSATPTPPREPAASAWVESTLADLDLKRKVAQLVFPRIGGEYFAEGGGSYERMKYWVKDLGVGGLIITIGPPLEMAAKLNAAQDMADIPVLVTADMEAGPGQVLYGGTVLPYGLETGGATRFPPLMAFGAAGDPRLAYELGRITAIEGRAAGVHVTFAPVVDVNNNPANPIINTRSYGADPGLVARLAVAHIRGLQEHGMQATVKHFPGHGDTETDSHVSLPTIAVDRGRADTVELPPYRAAFDAGVAGVMTAHITFPAIGGDLPATLNPRILTGLLRRDLGFRGVVYTDALDMGAIVNGWGAMKAPVMALQAGADVLLQVNPGDVAPVIDAIVAAVRAGELTEDRIDESVRRVLAAKESLGLNREAKVSLEKLPSILGNPAHMALADTVAQRAITAVRDRDRLLPVRAQRVLSVIYTDDYDPWTGRTFQRELGSAIGELRTASLTERSTPEELARLRAQAQEADVILFSPFIRVRASKGSIALVEPVAAWVREVARVKPVVMTSFGNPYVLQQLPELSTYVVAWGNADAAQRAAARALTGRAAITGKLPISIPPLHGIGEGLQVAPTHTQ